MKQSYKKALKLYEKAARQGLATAQFNLGVLYDNGVGVRLNYWKAAMLYMKAAEQGHLRAKFAVGFWVVFASLFQCCIILAFYILVTARHPALRVSTMETKLDQLLFEEERTNGFVFAQGASSMMRRKNGRSWRGKNKK